MSLKPDGKYWFLNYIILICIWITSDKGGRSKEQASIQQPLSNSLIMQQV